MGSSLPLSVGLSLIEANCLIVWQVSEVTLKNTKRKKIPQRKIQQLLEGFYHGEMISNTFVKLIHNIKLLLFNPFKFRGRDILIKDTVLLEYTLFLLRKYFSNVDVIRFTFIVCMLYTNLLIESNKMLIKPKISGNSQQKSFHLAYVLF